MAFSSLKLNTTPAIPRVVTRKDSSLKTQASLQFERSTPKIILNGGSNISRRDALSCVTSTLLFTALIQTEPADAHARITRPDMRRTLMEKLEQLREKAGLKKKENTAPKEEKKIPKLAKKEQPKEEKKFPKLEKNEKKEQPKEEKKEPSSDNKEQPKLVEASF
ncbi:hypothetical protein FCM35_KLT15428 [Carex littledalei]|uniref:Uncharacterized protein n=1 Tax=Carex littledalei TaxID=544730 RepID=A0A833VGW3_9POAL|nr:hypothetical protein FCM35_KLT15428 [Carex littledalei]